ncbi:MULTISPECIES: hypothetical protein [unclassified Polaromonas]|uniref:hypothetical protein n=1 Tax=unclassified Polaromonas TaxID=2638319 RepID=UPI0018C94AEC|nr:MULTISPECIES: hypothetical protein [unclassified Polaromonas]MBG6070266.1 hypothetical protein [Polaromonas sp. CG_9.7]MBG6112264.1 hypothetical protein [Polaromonas sp. CG_9.2]
MQEGQFEESEQFGGGMTASTIEHGCMAPWRDGIADSLQVTAPGFNPAILGIRYGKFDTGVKNLPYIRHYISNKEKGLTTIFIAINPCLYWCRRDESNTRPSHYEEFGC